MAVSNQQVLDAIKGLRDEDLSEIKSKLDKLNGRQRETEQTISSLVQWRRDHEAVATEMRSEIKSLRGRTNWVGAALAVAQVVVAGIGAILFGNDGQP